jgi:hypothetical protein
MSAPAVAPSPTAKNTSTIGIPSGAIAAAGASGTSG